MRDSLCVVNCGRCSRAGDLCSSLGLEFEGLRTLGSVPLASPQSGRVSQAPQLCLAPACPRPAFKPAVFWSRWIKPYKHGAGILESGPFIPELIPIAPSCGRKENSQAFSPLSADVPEKTNSAQFSLSLSVTSLT